jgi:hypothetical protein
MFIQVRSVPLSQEWEVMVEPSAEASLPTRMLVQLSESGLCARDVGAGDSANVTNKRDAIAIGKHRRIMRSGCICLVILLSLLRMMVSD